MYAGPRTYENLYKDLFSTARLAMELFLDRTGKMNTFLLNPSAREGKITFFPSVFLEVDISLERSFWSTGKPVLNTSILLRYDRQVSRKSEGKIRHRDNFFTSPAEGLSFQSMD